MIAWTKSYIQNERKDIRSSSALHPGTRTHIVENQSQSSQIRSPPIATMEDGEGDISLVYDTVTQNTWMSEAPSRQWHVLTIQEDFFIWIKHVDSHMEKIPELLRNLLNSLGNVSAVQIVQKLQLIFKATVMINSSTQMVEVAPPNSMGKLFCNNPYLRHLKLFLRKLCVALQGWRNSCEYYRYLGHWNQMWRRRRIARSKKWTRFKKTSLKLISGAVFDQRGVVQSFFGQTCSWLFIQCL